jgi:hypothetical protein
VALRAREVASCDGEYLEHDETVDMPADGGECGVVLGVLLHQSKAEGRLGGAAR